MLLKSSFSVTLVFVFATVPAMAAPSAEQVQAYFQRLGVLEAVKEGAVVGQMRQAVTPAEVLSAEVLRENQNLETEIKTAKDRHRQEFGLINLSRRARAEWKAQVTPLQETQKQIYRLVRKTSNVLRELKTGAQMIEFRSGSYEGICGVYNPSTDKVEWKSSYRAGVSGVYNPRTQQVEWRESYREGIAGVFNPMTNKVEWQENDNGAIAGVFNPQKGQVEWFRHFGGIAAVYNPLTGKVETAHTHTGASIAGIFDPEQGQVVWDRSIREGMAVVRKSANPPAYSNSCSYSEDDDE